MKLFRFATLCLLFLSQSIPAQEKTDISFRDFIDLLKNGRADNSLCLKFLRVSPYTTDYGDTLTISVFHELPNYAAILMTSTKTSYYSEARPVETFDTVETYDWDGNKLDSFEYGYELEGSYDKKSIRSEINEFDEITRTTHFTEVAVDLVNTDIPGNPQYDFRTVLDTTYTERFRISEKGLREGLSDISFREFIELFRLHQAGRDLCIWFLHAAPYDDWESRQTIRVFLERSDYVAIIIEYTGGGGESSTIKTYDWDGNKLDSFEYGYEGRENYFQKSLRCEINDLDEVTRTTKVIGRNYWAASDTSWVERFRISEKGIFESQFANFYAQSEIKLYWEIRNYYLTAHSSHTEVFLNINDGQEKKVFIFYERGSVSIPKSDPYWLVRIYNVNYGYHLLVDGGSISVLEDGNISMLEGRWHNDHNRNDYPSTEIKKIPITPGKALSFQPSQSIKAKQLYHRALSLQAKRMNGDDVWALQRFLVEQGYPEIGEIDGWFGPNTEKAVKRFQNSNKFKADGVVDQKVWDALSGVEYGENQQD